MLQEHGRAERRAQQGALAVSHSISDATSDCGPIDQPNGKHGRTHRRAEFDVSSNRAAYEFAVGLPVLLSHVFAVHLADQIANKRWLMQISLPMRLRGIHERSVLSKRTGRLF